MNQCYIVARLLQSDAMYIIAVVPAGGGKTYIILTLTLAFLLMACKPTVYIVTSNNMLKSQLQAVLLPYIQGKDVQIAYGFPMRENTKKPFFVLIDESDETMDVHAVKFSPSG